MRKEHQQYIIIAVSFLVCVMIVGKMFSTMRSNYQARQERIALAKSLVETLADVLASRTNDRGVIVKDAATTQPIWEPTVDPWGRVMDIQYKTSLVGETVTVRCLGPDGRSHTSDDIVAERKVINFKGLGNAVKEGSGETVKSMVKGGIQGVKEGLRRDSK